MRFLRCFSKYSLCTASTVLTVPSESQSCVLWIPNLPTSFVCTVTGRRLRTFGSRIESVCHTNTSVFFGVCFSGERCFLGECCWEERRRRFFLGVFLCFFLGFFFWVRRGCFGEECVSSFFTKNCCFIFGEFFFASFFVVQFFVLVCVFVFVFLFFVVFFFFTKSV